MDIEEEIASGQQTELPLDLDHDVPDSLTILNPVPKQDEDKETATSDEEEGSDHSSHQATTPKLVARDRFKNAVFHVWAQLQGNTGFSGGSTGAQGAGVAETDGQFFDDVSRTQALSGPNGPPCKQKLRKNQSGATASDKLSGKNRKRPTENVCQGKSLPLQSVVGLMVYRNLYRAKLKKSKKTDRGTLDRPAAPPETEILPNTPRFSSTLSPQAQLAMLQAYDEKLTASLSEKGVDELQEVVRRRSPPVVESLVSSGDEVGVQTQLRVTKLFEKAMTLLDSSQKPDGSPDAMRKDYHEWCDMWDKQFNQKRPVKGNNVEEHTTWKKGLCGLSFTTE